MRLSKIIRMGYIFIAAISIMLFSLFGLGCRHEHFSFAKLSQEERVKYVAEHLYNEYGVEFKVSNVRQRQINVFCTEDKFFATASCRERDYISVWVDKNGEIVDSGFVVQMKESIEKCFKGIIDKYINDYYVIDVFTLFRSEPQIKWNNTDDAMEMLKSEDVICAVRIYVENDTEITTALLADIYSETDFCATELYVYKVENIYELDPLSVELVDYSYVYRGAEK